MGSKFWYVFLAERILSSDLRQCLCFRPVSNGSATIWLPGFGFGSKGKIFQNLILKNSFKIIDYLFLNHLWIAHQVLANKGRNFFFIFIQNISKSFKKKLMALDPDPFLGCINMKWIITSDFRRRRWSLSLKDPPTPTWIGYRTGQDPGASTPPTPSWIGYRTGQVYLLPGK